MSFPGLELTQYSGGGDIPEILRQSADHCNVSFAFRISAGRDPCVEFFRPALDGLEIAKKLLARSWMNFVRFLTQTSLSNAYAGAFPKGHLRVYSTGP